jgi:NADH dehydrogenase [ubiquinone] 1 alpha subcomplex assembly factor 1
MVVRSLIVVFAAVASLTACGGDGEGTAPSGQGSVGSAGAQASTTVAADGGTATSTTADPTTAGAATDPAPSTSAAAAPLSTTVAAARTSITAMTTGPASTSPPLIDFGADGSAEGWGVVNDTVMGGVSSGQLAPMDGVLVFTGDLSLENNGGFASMRSPVIEPQRAAVWATRIGPRLEVEGDGRTWTVEVRTDEGDGGWIASLPTSPDDPIVAQLSWTEFEPVTRFLDPRETDVEFDPARIGSLAFYLVDGIEGPFRLAVRSIG